MFKHFNATHTVIAICTVLFTVLFFGSCNSCDDADCPDGYECQDGECEPILGFDQCSIVVCADGQTCNNGVCEDTYITVNKTGNLTSNETWTKDNVYVLSGKVIVDDGVTLTIEAGTIIKGSEGEGSIASTLIVARGGKINAIGTANEPIIFTSVLDNIKPTELIGSNSTEDLKGLWGGLVILGKAKVSSGNADTEDQIEGIPPNELYGRYGGDNDSDNSGTLRYVSIRHGGSLIGDGNEINGLTLGGVGSGTTIDHIEVVANLDDGIECFGGSVNITNAIVVGQGDDGLDIDQSYAGMFDNAIVIQDTGSDSAMEIDGPEGSTYNDGKFRIVNSTFIGGSGINGKDRAATLKSKAQGEISNCTFIGDFDTGLRFRANFDDAGCNDRTDAYTYATDGSNSLVVSNNQMGTTLSLDDWVEVFTDSETCSVPNEYQSVIDAAFQSKTNTATDNFSLGANKEPFRTWTWADVSGKLNY